MNFPQLSGITLPLWQHNDTTYDRSEMQARCIEHIAQDEWKAVKSWPFSSEAEKSKEEEHVCMPCVQILIS